MQCMIGVHVMWICQKYKINLNRIILYKFNRMGGDFSQGVLNAKLVILPKKLIDEEMRFYMENRSTTTYK
ncbi:hypothetical protein RCL_jg6318.t2 [Rhizophagus clarus]|uniref:Uncharacterized protein n=1 Tax=Rhizophagus clarus TaxID=94130 RepID=A0A8H3L067_9GLOM|nr:hypothetical protein RCL_jg6318.t2 [Rhizophagus clarus]